MTQSLGQSRGVLQQLDLKGTLEQHRPRIEPRLHRHDADTGLGITLHQAPLNRPSTPPARQQRAVAVPAAQGRLLQHLRRQQLSKGHHNREISLQGR